MIDQKTVAFLAALLLLLFLIRRRRRCLHDWQWRHNYYGDQIIYNGGMRSAWECSKCGRWQCRPELKN